MKIKCILALGDCNTLGVEDSIGDAYPEKLAHRIEAKAINCGHTMSTTREGLHYFSDQFSDQVDIVTIQYGLVDSWETFKYSPYVLYYPDSKLRKILRKLVKKFKKYCRKWGLNKVIGTSTVVPIDEYESNIQSIIKGSKDKLICLIDTVPNTDISRNKRIKEFNACLSKLAQENNCIKIDLYDYFESRLDDDHYVDPTHLSNVSHAYIAIQLEEKLKELL